ncbi:MAG: hypothetical protein C4522_18305 [Desulfobacteraceae bacterium]|nr:MAG: hypothetical protein C4522_18305 [Desulfobacteraceae bacterium]
MKPTKQTIAFLLTTLAVAAISLSGCASTGLQRSEQASTSMQAVDNDIKLIVVQLDATNAALDQLTRSGQSDVKTAFDLYADNVSKLAAMETDFAENAAEMKARGKDYFDEWKIEGNQYKNPRIQELSDQRRMELGEVYGEIPLNSIGVKDAFRTYVSDATEIQTYLSNDLTARGVESIAPLAKRVARDGDDLKHAIQKLETAIERARAEMAQSGR